MSLPGQIGPYRPLLRVGTGGMGTVYFAYHPQTGAPVAVKALHRDFAADAGYRARFTREVAVLRKVAGPYVIPLIDADTSAAVPWLAMPYVPGHTLHEHVRQHGALRTDNLLTFATAVAHALACIHAAGVAHRDLKPANVILADDGPRVVDFGIAHHLDATAITTTSIRTGTPGWMAPEQFIQGVTTPASDIFAWGLLVAYAAAGTHPFGTPTGIDHRIVHASPDLQAVPARLLPLVTHALNKDANHRPTAAQLAEQAAGLHGPSGTAVFPTVAYTQQAGKPAPTAALNAYQWDIPHTATDLTQVLPNLPSDGHVPPEIAQALLFQTEALLDSDRQLAQASEAAGFDPTQLRSAVTAAEGALTDIRRRYELGDTAALSDLTTALAPVIEGRTALHTQIPPHIRHGGLPPVSGAFGPPQAPPRPTHAPYPGAVPRPGWPPHPNANAGRRTKRPRGVVIAATVAAIALVTGSVAYATAKSRHTHTRANAPAHTTTPPTSRRALPPTLTPTPTPTLAPTTTAPSPTPTATRATFFGGLHLTVPASWNAQQVAADDLSDTSSLTPKYAMSVAVDASDPSSAGVAIEWLANEPPLDDSTADGSGPDFQDFGIRFSVGPVAPSQEYGATSPPEQTTTSIRRLDTKAIAGRPTRGWTVHTDVLPDYHHTRAAVHRVWYLPHAHFVIYTYGTLNRAQNSQVDAILASAKIAAFDLPLDCADAIAFLDTSAAGGSPAGEDPSQNCLDLTSDPSASTYGDTPTPLDPGSITTKTAPECLTLLETFSAPNIYPGNTPAYTAARKRCDFPRKR